MSAPPRLGTYETAHGPEPILARGPLAAPQLLLILPLFEEAGFTRSFASDLLRRLAERGIGGWLFDLPGVGDSVTPLETIRLADWRQAVRDALAHVVKAASGPVHIAALRGGALLVPPRRPAWRLAACDGAALLRPLRRAAALGDSAGLGGWPASEALVQDLAGAALPPLVDGGRDVEWPSGTPPWRRAEPGRDPAPAALLADDLARWICPCAGH